MVKLEVLKLNDINDYVTHCRFRDLIKFQGQGTSIGYYHQHHSTWEFCHHLMLKNDLKMTHLSFSSNSQERYQKSQHHSMPFCTFAHAIERHPRMLKDNDARTTVLLYFKWTNRLQKSSKRFVFLASIYVCKVDYVNVVSAFIYVFSVCLLHRFNCWAIEANCNCGGCYVRKISTANQ